MHDLLEELRRWLDEQTITPGNIDDIRRQCCMPWSSAWNMRVREETANRENRHTMNLTLEQIARVCHEANRAYCAVLGDHSQQPWDAAAEWQRKSVIEGVKFALDNPHAPASHQHDAWLQDKLDAGWKHGPVKDPAKKEHPCIVPYDRLPAGQRCKDALFKAVVSALSGE
jgi:RyR domain-containing protein